MAKVQEQQQATKREEQGDDRQQQEQQQEKYVGIDQLHQQVLNGEKPANKQVLAMLRYDFAPLLSKPGTGADKVRNNATLAILTAAIANLQDDSRKITSKITLGNGFRDTVQQVASSALDNPEQIDEVCDNAKRILKGMIVAAASSAGCNVNADTNAANWLGEFVGLATGIGGSTKRDRTDNLLGSIRGADAAVKPKG